MEIDSNNKQISEILKHMQTRKRLMYLALMILITYTLSAENLFVGVWVGMDKTTNEKAYLMFYEEENKAVINLNSGQNPFETGKYKYNEKILTLMIKGRYELHNYHPYYYKRIDENTLSSL